MLTLGSGLTGDLSEDGRGFSPRSEQTNNIYVMLDEGAFYYHFDSFEALEIPDFKGLIDRFEKLYRTDLNSRPSQWFKIAKNRQGKKPGSAIVAANVSKMKERLIQLEGVVAGAYRQPTVAECDVEAQPESKATFQFWRKNYVDVVVDGLEQARARLKGGAAGDCDFGSVFENPADVEFVQKLSRTQAFTYYLETHS
jgi:hypothetical protein